MSYYYKEMNVKVKIIIELGGPEERYKTGQIILQWIFYEFRVS